MEKKTAAVLSVLAVFLIAASGAYAFGLQGNEDARAALENNDYDAFIAAVSETERGEKFAERMTEERFGHMVEGFEANQEVRGAIEAGDYDAWAAAVNSRPRITDFISEENFDTFVAMHEAMQEGDMEAAHELAEELGLPMGPRGMGKGEMHGMHGMHGKGPGFGAGNGPCAQTDSNPE